MPEWEVDGVELLQGDCLELMKGMGTENKQFFKCHRWRRTFSGKTDLQQSRRNYYRLSDVKSVNIGFRKDSKHNNKPS